MRMVLGLRRLASGHALTNLPRGSAPPHHFNQLLPPSFQRRHGCPTQPDRADELVAFEADAGHRSLSLEKCPAGCRPQPARRRRSPIPRQAHRPVAALPMPRDEMQRLATNNEKIYASQGGGNALSSPYVTTFHRSFCFRCGDRTHAGTQPGTRRSGLSGTESG